MISLIYRPQLISCHISAYKAYGWTVRVIQTDRVVLCNYWTAEVISKLTIVLICPLNHPPPSVTVHSWSWVPHFIHSSTDISHLRYLIGSDISLATDDNQSHKWCLDYLHTASGIMLAKMRTTPLCKQAAIKLQILHKVLHRIMKTF